MRMGHPKKAAVRESLRLNFQPMLLTSVTTAIGFLSLNFSDTPPYRDLGNLVAMGVVIAFLLTITFLPAIMTLLPVRVKTKDDPDATLMKRLGLFVIRKRIALLIINGLLAVFFISFTPINELNDEFVKYFDNTTDFRQATDFLNNNMGGIYTVELSMHADAEGGINEPDFLHKIDKFSEWLRQQPEVVHVNTITDIFRRLSKNMHGDNAEWYKLALT